MKTKCTVLSMMTAGAILALGPVAVRAHGGGGGAAHGGMGTEMGIGASGGMNAGMAGGIGTTAHGDDLGRPEGSLGGALGRPDDAPTANASAETTGSHEHDAGANAAASSEMTGHSDRDTVHATPGHPDSDMDKTEAGRSARTDALQLASTMHSINEAAFEARRQLLKTVNMRLKSSHAALRAIQSNASTLRADARAKFQTDLEQLKARTADLNHALKATKDSDDAAWATRRAALAAAYQNYASAMERVELDARNGS